MDRSITDVNHVDNDYIALIDLDFSWMKKDINRVARFWREGKSIAEISEYFNREIDEVFLLLLDLARKHKIDSRKEGLYDSSHDGSRWI